MEQVLRQYGRGILAACTCLLLLLLLFSGITDEAGNRGILKIVGARVQTEQLPYDSFKDFSSVQEEAQRPKPVVEEQFKSSTITAGESYRLTDYVRAVDDAAVSYPVVLEKVENGKKEDVTADTYGEGLVCFPDSGIYKLRLRVRNAAAKKNWYTIQVSVMRGK